MAAAPSMMSVDELRAAHRFLREVDVDLQRTDLLSSGVTMHAVVASAMADTAMPTPARFDALIDLFGVAGAYRERRDATHAELQACVDALSRLTATLEPDRFAVDGCAVCRDDDRARCGAVDRRIAHGIGGGDMDDECAAQPKRARR